MDVSTATIGFLALGAIAALAAVAAWPRRRPSVLLAPRLSSRSSHRWFGGDPVYVLGGDAGAVDRGAGSGGSGGGCS